MDKWIQRGQFSLDILENWIVSEEHDSTEITPKANDAAIHISTFVKTAPSAPTRETVIALVQNFAKNNKLRPTENCCVEMQENFGACTAHFSGNGAPSEPLVWVVRSVVGKAKAVLATLCIDDVSARSYVEGLSIVDSIKIDEDSMGSKLSP